MTRKINLNALTPGEQRKLGIIPGPQNDPCGSEYNHDPDKKEPFNKNEYPIGRDN